MAPSLQAWLQIALLGGCLGILYFPVLASLVKQWAHDPNYSHGLFVPLFAAWVVWARRKQLSILPSAPSWLGFAILLVALATLVLGVLGAENFLSRVSFVLALAGLTIQFRGWHYFRSLVFPWAALFLMIPLPAIIFNEISLPLQLVASRLGSLLLNLGGVATVREGNVIQMSSVSLDVAEACSGLRSLMSLITVGVFYGYFKEPRPSRRLWIILAAVPIAIGANALRIMGTGLIGEYWGPERIQGFLHIFSGVVVFAISLMLLMFLHSALCWADRLVQVWKSV